MKKILLLHGPNLNLLGQREPKQYGTATSESILAGLRQGFPDLTIAYFQSNREDELVDAIQQSPSVYDGILLNAGAFSHTSIALADAIKSIKTPVIAVHISNIYNREEYRHTDIVGDACSGCITGLGAAGYTLALECLLESI